MSRRLVPLAAYLRDALAGWLGSTLLVLLLVGMLLGCGAEAPPLQEVAVAGEQPAKKKVPAPGLQGATDWLNVAGPLTLEDLRGRVVLLDFWTLCCINCIHTLPDLAKLEAKYPGILVVLGIHTPKFENEKLTSSIRKAILRYEIKHPVVNDADMRIWRRYGVRSWPTLVLIDPDGNYYGQISGEGAYEVLDQHIGKLVKEYRAKKALKEEPINFALVKEAKPTQLYFPGKVLADTASNRLFIADSTNHRVVITTLDGKKIAIAGGSAEGNKDGSFDQARFSDPQGMTLDGDTLYLADRKNHLIRALDLKKQTVKTVAGVGEQDRESRFGGGPALEVGLNSPWDLLLHNGKIFVAMAGHHQIWTFEPAKKRVDPFAGSGRETLEDGPLPQSAFAQPSGLATDGQYLYVADCETSSIRAVPIDGKGNVKTLVGEDLFEFGDVDGKGKMVRLQHALGVAVKDGKIYVADTYNSKIKVLTPDLADPDNTECRTFLGDPPGWLKAKMFNEPGGISIAGSKMYVADTNNHRIRVVDMNTKYVTTLNLEGVEPPKREKMKAQAPGK
ncbi:MAG: redoxin domain-containing protein [Gemmataceae bacterium]|nr:redoxin domain-containing protein [Gemmataceae bacterium]